MQKDFRGLWTALATPFRADGAIDWPAFEKLVHMQVEAKVTGLVIAGTTGEAATLSVQEKLSLIRKAKALAGHQLLLMAGSGGQSTSQSLELSKLAIDAGADSLLVVTPPYVKPNPQGLVAHFQTLAEACPVPICLYHVPGRTGQRLSPQDLGKLCAIPGVSLVKEASGDLAFFAESLLSSQALFLSGDDLTFLASLAIGGEGCISVISNLYPQAMVSLYEAFKAGDLQKAKALHASLFPAMQAMFWESNPCPLKAALSLKGLCGNYLRLPLAPITNTHEQALQGLLAATDSKLETL